MNDDYATAPELERWLAACDPAPDDATLDAWAAEAREPIGDGDEPPGPDPSDPWRTRYPLEIFSGPMGTTRWLCPGLDLGPGRPWGAWGPPGSGKTVALLSLALSVASGKDVWQHLPTARGRVVWMSWDFGFKAIKLRLRQLANGMGLSLGDIGDNLVVCAHPSMSLSAQGAERAFAKRVKGFDLAIIDNLRDASPGLKENDSDFGERITLFGRVCELAGCTAVYLHHTRKGAEGAGIDAARGSSAIPAATGAAWLWKGQLADPRELVQVRRHDMADYDHDPIWVTQSDGSASGPFEMGVDQDGAPRRALIMTGTDERPDEPDPDEDLEGLIVESLRLNNDGSSGSRLASDLGKSKKSVLSACANLLEIGRIMQIGNGPGQKYRLTDGS